LSSNALSNLNSAFEKLLGDLGGNASSAAGGTASSVSGTASGTSSPASSGSAAASQSTIALQSFLTSFLQDLQNNGANSFSPLGSSINTTA